MGNLMEILLKAKIGNDSIGGIQKQIKDIQETVKPMKIDIDTSKATSSMSQISRAIDDASKLEKDWGTAIKMRANEHQASAIKMNKSVDSAQNKIIEDAIRLEKDWGQAIKMRMNEAHSTALTTNKAMNKAQGQDVKDAIRLEKDWGTAIKMRMNEAHSAALKMDKSMDKVKTSSMNMQKSFGAALGSINKVAMALGVSLSIAGLVRAVKTGIKSVTELDTSLTELSKVSDLTGSQLEAFTDEAYAAGKTIGRTGKEVIDATTSFKRAGYDIKEAFELSGQALLLTNIGDGINSVEDASSSLISILKGFKMEAKETAHVVDALNQVSNNFAIDTVNLTEIMERVSGTVAQTGTTYEELLGLSTGGFETLRNAEMVSSGINMITMRLKGMKESGEEVEGLVPKIQKSFDKYTNGTVSIINEQNGELNSTYDILQQLSKVYPTLTDEAKAYLNEAVAGTRQNKVLVAIMENWENVEAATASATDSLNSASIENEKYLNSIEGKTAGLKSSMESFWKNLINSDLIKRGVDSLSSFVGVMDGLANTSLPTLVLQILGSATAAMVLFKGLNILKSVFVPIISLFVKTGIAASGATTLLGLTAASAGAMVAAVAVAVGISALAITSHLSKIKKEKEEVDKLITDLPEIRLKQNDDIKYMEETAKEFERLNELVGRNGDLSAMSAKQKERYLEITKKLSEMSPEMESFYNSEGELIADNTTKMKDLIDAKKEEMRITALKAQAGISDKFKDHEKAIKSVDKERESIAKKIETQEKHKKTLEDQLKVYEKIGAHEDAINSKKKAILETDEKIADLQGKSRDAGLEIVESLEELNIAVKGSLELMGAELDNITPKTEAFEQTFKNMLKDDPEGGVANVKKALRELGLIFDDLDKKVANGEKLMPEDMKYYVGILEDAGVSSKDATKNMLETFAVIESGEDKVKLLSKAFNEFSAEGKISADMAKLLHESFEGVPEGVEKIDASLISNMGKFDVWSASLLASQMEVRNGYSDMFEEIYGSKSKELKLSPGDLTNSDNALKKIDVARKSKDEVLKIIKEEAEEKKSITNVLHRELGVLTQNQADEENRITQEKSDQQVRDVKLRYQEIQAVTIESGVKTAKALELAMSETENVMRVFNEFDPELKEFVVKQVGVAETHKDFEKLFTTWLQENPKVKEFITETKGMEFIFENIDVLGTAWDELDPKEQEFHAKAVGTLLEDIDGFEKKWDAVDPEIKKYIAEAVGIEDVETANNETMATWAEDPAVKMFIASHGGLDKVVLELDKTTGKWEIPAGVKVFTSKEAGLSNIRTQLTKTVDAWNLAGNPSKIFTTTLNQVFKGMPKPQQKWTGDKNFSGGLSYVGERGRELLVYPDESYDMTGDSTELRNLPKGTRIYNNRDTEDILTGTKIPKFATGNTKAKTPSSSSSSKEEYRAVSDPYAKINFELNRNNVLLQLNNSYQEQAGDNIAKKISLMNEEIKYNKERQKLLSRNNTQLRDEAKLLQKDLSGIFNFKGSWNDNSMAITNMDAIAGKSEVIDTKFKRIVEIMGELPKASQSWLDLNNEIQKVNESIKQILAQEVIDRIAHSKDWIEKRKFYDDWGADNEISSLERVRKYIKEYYAQGIIDYKEYSDQMLEMDKAVASFREAREQERNSALDNAQEKVVAIIRKRGEVEKKAHQDSYDAEVLALKDKETAIKKSYSDELESFRKMVQGKIDALDDQYDEEDYLEQLNKERKEATEIQKQIDVLSLDTSLTARNKVIDLRKQLADQNEKVAKMQQNKERELLKESLQGQLKDKEEDAKNKEEITTKYYELENENLTKTYEAKKQNLEDMYLDAKVYAEAEKALRDGTVQDIKGNFVDITVAFNDFEDEFGKGMGILGDVIKTDFIDQLKLAKLAIEDLNRIERGSNYGKGSIGGSNEANNTKLREDKAYLASEIARTEEVISDRKFDGMDVKDQEAYLKRLLTGDYKRSPDYGKGTNSTAKASKDNTAKLKADNAYLASEIKRTNQVISDRKNAGMSVKDQEAYLKRLTSGSYDNGGKITNTGLTLNNFHGTEQNPEWIFNDEQLKKLLTKATQSAINFAIPKIPNMSSLGNAGGDTYDITFDVKGNMDRSIFPEVQKMITSTIERTQAQKISKYRDVGIKRPIY